MGWGYTGNGDKSFAPGWGNGYDPLPHLSPCMPQVGEGGVWHVHYQINTLGPSLDEKLKRTAFLVLGLGAGIPCELFSDRDYLYS